MRSYLAQGILYRGKVTGENTQKGSTFRPIQVAVNCENILDYLLGYLFLVLNFVENLSWYVDEGTNMNIKNCIHTSRIHQLCTSARPLTFLSANSLQFSILPSPWWTV